MLEKVKEKMAQKKALKQEEADARQAWFAALTAEEIKQFNPNLFYAMRDEWLANFHIEDLDATEPVGGFKEIVQYVILGVSILTLLVAFFHK